MGVGASLRMYDVVVKKFTFAISSPGEFLFTFTTFAGFCFNCCLYVCLSVCLLAG